MPLFLSNSCHFSVHKTEISKFLARILMEYFHMGIFVMPGVCLIRKYGSQTTAKFPHGSFFDGQPVQQKLRKLPERDPGWPRKMCSVPKTELSLTCQNLASLYFPKNLQGSLERLEILIWWKLNYPVPFEEPTFGFLPLKNGCWQSYELS